MIVSKSVEYEKLKFKEFLETVEDGLSATRKWLVSKILFWRDCPRILIEYHAQFTKVSLASSSSEEVILVFLSENILSETGVSL